MIIIFTKKVLRQGSVLPSLFLLFFVVFIIIFSGFSSFHPFLLIWLLSVLLRIFYFLWANSPSSGSRPTPWCNLHPVDFIYCVHIIPIVCTLIHLKPWSTRHPDLLFKVALSIVHIVSWACYFGLFSEHWRLCEWDRYFNSSGLWLIELRHELCIFQNWREVQFRQNIFLTYFWRRTRFR